MSAAYVTPASATGPVVRPVPGLPFLGNLLDLRGDRFRFARKIAAEQGDLASLSVGFRPILMVSSPAIAHEVLVEKAESFIKSAGLAIFARPVLGDGLLTSEREVHRRQRRMMAPVFAHKRIASYGDIMVAKAQASVARLEPLKTADLSEEMMRLTLDIVGKTLFDADLATDASVIGEALTEAMRQMMNSLVRLIPTPPSVPTIGNLRMKAAVRRLDRVVYSLIRERRASGEDRGDMLGMLLATRDADDGSALSDREVRDQAMTIMLAGHETTANALAWTFYLLARHPDVRARLEAEVDEAIGNRSATVADLPKMPFALQVLKESMRLYPPAYVIGRRATHPLTVGGAKVGKGQLVILNVVGIHRRASEFPDPDRFVPDRFTPEREKALPPQAFMPFGAGPRICIGNHFALMEGHLLLATLTQRLRFDLQSDAPIDAEPLVTLRPKGGLPVTVAHR